MIIQKDLQTAIYTALEKPDILLISLIRLLIKIKMKIKKQKDIIIVQILSQFFWFKPMNIYLDIK